MKRVRFRCVLLSALSVCFFANSAMAYDQVYEEFDPNFLYDQREVLSSCKKLSPEDLDQKLEDYFHSRKNSYYDQQIFKGSLSTLVGFFPLLPMVLCRLVTGLWPETGTFLFAMQGGSYFAMQGLEKMTQAYEKRYIARSFDAMDDYEVAYVRRKRWLPKALHAGIEKNFITARTTPGAELDNVEYA